jgi:hypothetical protein
MKLFSKNIVFIVKDNQLGSYYLDLGYFKESAEVGVTLQSSDNFVSVNTFTNTKDMLEYMKGLEEFEFNFSMAIDERASDLVVDKYFKDNED